MTRARGGPVRPPEIGARGDARAAGRFGNIPAAAHQRNGIVFELAVVSTRELALRCFPVRFFLFKSPSPRNRETVNLVPDKRADHSPSDITTHRKNPGTGGVWPLSVRRGNTNNTVLCEFWKMDTAHGFIDLRVIG
ncbi:MAG: hypothetical protein WCH98_00905 [Verrucomicrobiota bacterium]